jgi:flagella basal body P-ring formation protein FlgA
MMPALWIAMLLFLPAQACADTVVATHTIRAQTILGPEDVTLKSIDVPGAATSIQDVVGLETRVSLYAGHAIRMSSLGPPALVDRNQIVPLVYLANGLRIETEGRSLSRAGPGEYVRVMNLSSRTTVSGRVAPDGRVFVSH